MDIMDDVNFARFERAYIKLHDGRVLRESADSAEWLNIVQYLNTRDPFD